MDKPAALRLRLLGGFSVAVHGEPPTPIRISARKGRALLAYLAMHPEHSAGREELAALLWGDRPDQQARLSLRQCILRMRADLTSTAPDLLVLRDDAVGLLPHALATDALEFEALAGSTDLCGLERACALYRGEFLSGLNVDAEGFDEWMRATRHRLETVAACLFETCARQADDACDGKRALAAAERLVALDPLREDWQRIALRIHARHRGREAALAHAEALVALLKREIEVDPEPETRALIEEIERGAIAPVAPTALAAPPAIETARPEVVPPAMEHAAESAPPMSEDSTLAEILGTRPRPGWRDRTAPLAVAMFVTLLGPGLLTLDRPMSPGAGDAAALKIPDASGTSSASVLPALDPAASARNGFLVSVDNRIAVVVLPFTTLPGSEEAGPLADRITDEFIDVLEHIPALTLISRNTSHRYRSRPVDVAVVAKELGVQYVVDGSIRVDGNRLTINAELIDPISRLRLWSDQVDSDLAEAAEVDVLRRLGREIHVAKMRMDARRVPAAAPAVLGAADLVATGRNAMAASSLQDSLPEAEAAFRAALEQDPELIGAMVGLAAHHVVAVGNLVELPGPKLDEAEDLLARVLRKRPEWQPANFYRGILYNLRGELEAALESFARSVTTNPSFAPGYGQMGRMLTRLGRIEEGLEQIAYAMRLSPKDPDFVIWALFAGWAELERGQDAAALEWLTRAAGLNPKLALVHASLAAVHALTGDRANAERHAEKLRELTPAFTDEQRVAQMGGSLQRPAPHRLVDGVRLALAGSRVGKSIPAGFK